MEPSLQLEPLCSVQVGDVGTATFCSKITGLVLDAKHFVFVRVWNILPGEKKALLNTF